ncbi:MAG: sigma-54 dependent transcriptional regulator [Chloroherpetonaceae bacterium]|nr:sigma-54 dependent transcriptional regulator [Chloroherpetonaceae bacterium]
MEKSLLIIEDETSLRHLLTQLLTLEGFEVISSPNLSDAILHLRDATFHVILTDLKLPDGNGIDFIKHIQTEQPFAEIVVMTAFGTVQDGVSAMKLGAFDFITKGDDDERILLTVHKAFEKASLKKQVRDLEHKIDSKIGFEKLIGKSKEFSDAVELAKKVAPTDTTVLLLGETGTGKELFAEAIHRRSKRREKPFVAINCAAIPKDLQEAELFGYKRGAFTGAISDKKGIFEEANSGTIFLDEIGEMNSDTQAKLLRVLETRLLTKVGETKPKEIDVRIIAATNRDIEHESETGDFRKDLLYRLNGFTIYLPPLRDRESDIELLAEHFIALYSKKLGKKISGCDLYFKTKLKHYDWKGNLRELKNVIERAVILSSNDILSAGLLPKEILHYEEKPALMPINSTDFPDISLSDLEKIHIERVLKHCNGNRTHAAKKLGIGTATLYRKMKDYGLM